MKGKELVALGPTGTANRPIQLPYGGNKNVNFRLFTICNSEAASKVFFKGYLLGSLFLASIALFGFVSGAGPFSTLSGLLFLAAASLLSTQRRFRKSPFAIVFCIFTFLYLSLPTAFILAEGRGYIFGTGLAELPFKQEDYKQSLPWGLLYLSVSWVAVWLAIISIKTRSRRIDQTVFSTIRLRHVLLLGAIVLLVGAIDRMEFFDVYLLGAEKGVSLLAILLFVHAYLPMAGLILIFKLNQTPTVTPGIVSSVLASIFIGFVFLMTVSGSKAAVLTLLMLLFVYPFSFSRAYSNLWVAIPSMHLVTLLIIIALPLYFVVSVQRNLANDIPPNLDALLDALNSLDADHIYEIPKAILYRFSQAGVDRLLLVFHTFVVDGFSFGMAQEFLVYLLKNTLNLFLPGTPFMEAYAPTSQLYPIVIAKGHMAGDMTLSTLMQSFNTQAYTIFGTFTVIFGVTAPLFLFLFAYMFLIIFNIINNYFVKIAMIYLFSEALTCHGLEVVLANSAQVLVGIWFMYFSLKYVSQIRVLRNSSRASRLS